MNKPTIKDDPINLVGKNKGQKETRIWSRPPTAYNLFFRNERRKMSGEEQQEQNLQTLIGARWRSLDVQTRCKYEMSLRDQREQSESAALKENTEASDYQNEVFCQSSKKMRTEGVSVQDRIFFTIEEKKSYRDDDFVQFMRWVFPQQEEKSLLELKETQNNGNISKMTSHAVNASLLNMYENNYSIDN